MYDTYIIRPRWGDKKVCFWTEFEPADGVIWRCLDFYILHGVVEGSKTESVRSGRSRAKCSKTWRATESCARWAEHVCQLAMQCFRFLYFHWKDGKNQQKLLFTRKLLSTSFNQYGARLSDSWRKPLLAILSPFTNAPALGTRLDFFFLFVYS